MPGKDVLPEETRHVLVRHEGVRVEPDIDGVPAVPAPAVFGVRAAERELSDLTDETGSSGCAAHAARPRS